MELVHPYCIILLWKIYFFYLGSQSVSCKASLAALRLYGYFFLIFVLCLYRKINDDVIHVVTAVTK